MAFETFFISLYSHNNSLATDATEPWDGNVEDLDALKSKIKDTEHQLELVE